MQSAGAMGAFYISRHFRVCPSRPDWKRLNTISGIMKITTPDKWRDSGNSGTMMEVDSQQHTDKRSIVVHKNIPHRILACLLITLSLSIDHSIMFSGSIGDPYVIKEPFILLIGPLPLLYVRELRSPCKFFLRDLLNSIPFILVFFIIMPIWIFGSSTFYSQSFF